MGKDLKDIFAAIDTEGGLLRGVRLGIGHGARGRHDPSPYLGRRDVWALWRWTRQQGALPEVLAGWWLTLAPVEREQLRAHLGALSLVAWLALWWEARTSGPGTAGLEAHDQDEARPRP